MVRLRFFICPSQPGQLYLACYQNSVRFNPSACFFLTFPSIAVSFRSTQFRSISLYSKPQISSVFLHAIHSNIIVPHLVHVIVLQKIPTPFQSHPTDVFPMFHSALSVDESSFSFLLYFVHSQFKFHLFCAVLVFPSHPKFFDISLKRFWPTGHRITSSCFFLFQFVFLQFITHQFCPLSFPAFYFLRICVVSSTIVQFNCVPTHRTIPISSCSNTTPLMPHSSFSLPKCLISYRFFEFLFAPHNLMLSLLFCQGILRQNVTTHIVEEDHNLKVLSWPKSPTLADFS